MAVCKCEVGLSNTGLPSCIPIAGVTKRIIMLNYYDNDGNINSVDCSDTFDEAYFAGKVNESDKSKRWYPLPEIKNVEDTKADSIFESFNDGSNLFIQEGTRTFTGLMPKQSPEFLGQLKAARCVKIGVYVIDKDGNLIGNGKVDGKLLPILVDNNTWNPVLMKGTDTTVQKITLTFEYSRLERDEDLRMITADEFTFDILGIQGVKDVNFVNMTADAGTDSATFTAETIFGSQCAKVKVQGLDLADFSMTVNGAPAVLVSVDETTPGTYTLTTSTDIVATDVVVVDIVKDYFEVISGNTATA